MTKAQSREVLKARTYVTLGHVDMAARSLSALVRAASARAAAAIHAEAVSLGVADHPEYII